MLNISTVVNQLDLKEGQFVADLGSGVGHFSIPIAKKLGTKGMVYSVDIHRDILTRLSNDAKDLEISNIKTIWGDVESVGGTHIQNNTVDFVLFVNVMFQIHNRPAALREAMRIVKDGGRIVIIDWHEDVSVGPKSTIRFSLDELRRLCERFGLVFKKDISIGAYHYGIMFEKQG